MISGGRSLLPIFLSILLMPRCIMMLHNVNAMPAEYPFSMFVLGWPGVCTVIRQAAHVQEIGYSHVRLRIDYNAYTRETDNC
jgi:hypothetical protein